MNLMRQIYGFNRSKKTSPDLAVKLLEKEQKEKSSCWEKYVYGNQKNCLKLNPTYCLDEFESLLEILF